MSLHAGLAAAPGTSPAPKHGAATINSLVSPAWQSRAKAERLADVSAAALARNAGNPADFFHLPANRVIEMGSRVLI
jgi:K+ transporter